MRGCCPSWNWDGPDDQLHAAFTPTRCYCCSCRYPPLRSPRSAGTQGCHFKKISAGCCSTAPAWVMLVGEAGGEYGPPNSLPNRPSMLLPEGASSRTPRRISSRQEPAQQHSHTHHHHHHHHHDTRNSGIGSSREQAASWRRQVESRDYCFFCCFGCCCCCITSTTLSSHRRH